MTWLIVGANGQLGKSICAELRARNIRHLPWNRSDGSILDSEFVKMHVSQIRPSIIVNTAAWTDVDAAENNESQAEKINAEAVSFLAKAAREVSAIYVQISTDYVFSGESFQPWQEQDPVSPISVYGRTKAQGESFTQLLYPEGSYIFRTSWLYSQYGKNFAKTMVKKSLMEPKGNVSVVNDQFGQPTFATDLARQVIDSVNKKIPFGIYHATNSGQTTWYEFATEVFRLCDEDPNRVVPISSIDFKRIAPRPKYSVLGHDGWKATQLSEMQNWKLALKNSMPSILNSLTMEE